MKTKDNLYMDIHVLQNVPPSCINRDDTGSPKTAVYGGVTRARVSSQAWKKAMRDYFVAENVFSKDELGKRTKKLVSFIAGEISKLSADMDCEKAALSVLEAVGIKANDKDPEKTKALFFMGVAQARALAKFVVENPKVASGKANGAQKKEAKAILQGYPAVDIALFGRMLANDKQLNTDAAAQVAHSISTHKVIGEFDFFTAVDDMGEEDHAGSGFMERVEFNSSTLYRYATVALHDLKKNLGKDVADAAQGFIRAFVLSMPTGKQNTFANRTVPFSVLVTFRKDQPVNLSGAFERPVRPGRDGGEGYAQQSISALFEHARNVQDQWLGSPEKAFAVGSGLEGLAETLSLPELLKEVRSYVSNLLDGGEG